MPRHQLQQDGVTRLAASGSSTGERSTVGISLGNPNTAHGRVRTRLEVEIQPAGSAFSGGPLFKGSSFLDNTSFTSHTEVFTDLLARLGPSVGYRWRARLVYDPTQVPHDTHTAWFRPQWPVSGVSDFRTSKGYFVPTAPGIQLTPAPDPSSVDDLVCTVATPGSVHPDFTPVQYEYVWTNGGANPITITRGPKPDISDTLSSAFTVKDETWSCTVRAYDGFNFSEPVSASTNVVNAPPVAPVVTVPELQSQLLPMDCVITTASTDPDGDPVSYRYEWYRRTGGSSTFTLQEAHGPTTAASDTLSASLLVAGDDWYCTVTPLDSESAEGAPASSSIATIVPAGTLGSSIVLVVSPQTVTIGQSLNFAGQITGVGGPPPAQFGTTVSFNASNPLVRLDGAPDPSTATGDSGFNQSFFPTEVGALFTVEASWPGDLNYDEATSTPPQSFSVDPKLPDIAIVDIRKNGVSVSSVDRGSTNVEVHVAVDGNLPPALSFLEEHVLVEVSMLNASGSTVGTGLARTDATGLAVFSLPADLSIPDLNTEGTFQLVAQALGRDTNADDAVDAGSQPFLQASTAGFGLPGVTHLTVVGSPGYAVLVLGALDDQKEGLPEHRKTMDYVYRSFIQRGFPAENLYYLREAAADETVASLAAAGIRMRDVTSPVPDNVLLGPTSQDDVQFALETWAAGQIAGDAAPLYLVIIDHGSVGQFFTFDSSSPTPFDADRVITPSELDGFLDTGEAAYGAVTDPAKRRVTVIYGACHSGSFIPGLRDPDRILITSCKAEEISHRGPLDTSGGIRDGELFITELFRELRLDASLKEAFEKASGRIANFTVSESNSGSPTAELPQEPQLEDNNDGAGSVASALGVEIGEDGHRSFSAFLGVSGNTGDPVGWFSTTGTVTDADTLTVLTATATAAPAVGVPDEAWIEVKTPAYTGATVADGAYPEFQQFVNLTRFDADPVLSDPANAVYRWDLAGLDITGGVTLSSLLAFPGTYQVYYFIKDGQSGDVSPQALTLVYQDGGVSNNPPTPVSLAFPAGGEVVGANPHLGWTPSTDPDFPLDSVTYRLEVHTDPSFPTDNSIFLRVDGLAENFHALTGLSDGDYFWRVIPFDSFGATPPAAPEVGQFTVDNTNTGEGTGFINVQLLEQANPKLPYSGPAQVVLTASSGCDTQKVITTPVFGFYRSVDLNECTWTVEVTLTDVNIRLRPRTVTLDADTQGVELTFIVAQELAALLRDTFSPTADENSGLTFIEAQLALPGLTQALFDLLDALDGSPDDFVSLEDLVSASVNEAEPPTDVWVDFAHTGAESGTNIEPFNTLPEGVSLVKEAGNVHIRAGSQPGPITLNKSLTLRATGGTVTLGASP